MFVDSNFMPLVQLLTGQNETGDFGVKL